tara:strand:- start:3202 stop:4155 length:954 start_codon:yes stop_codon:yes gene_type:complete
MNKIILVLFITSVSAFSYNPFPNLWNSLNNNLQNTARDWFIKRAEGKGIEWNKIKDFYDKNQIELDKQFTLVNNHEIEYPDYYTKPFHGYNEGNLNWKASMECEASTLSMSSHYFDNMTPQETSDYIRYNFINFIKSYNENNFKLKIKEVLDIGCSIGVSTEYLYKSFRGRVNGLDLSPYYLSIAKFNAMINHIPINYFHSNAESIDINDNSVDLVTASFIFHEIPNKETKLIFKEILRILKPGGIIAITDLDPLKLKDKLSESKFRKFAFEITEPHINEYYERSVESDLFLTGFYNIEKSDSDPYNSIWIASKDIF